jgi:hypothetical protein
MVLLHGNQTRHLAVQLSVVSLKILLTISAAEHFGSQTCHRKLGAALKVAGETVERLIQLRKS